VECHGLVHDRKFVSAASLICNTLNKKRNMGERISGKIPFGSKLAKNGINLVPVPNEVKAIKMILSLRYKKKLSLWAIARVLTSKGIKPKGGGKWQATCIRGIIKRQERLLNKKSV